MVWRGADGSVWDLTDPDGPVTAEPGLTGVLDPPITQHMRSGPMPGARSLGVSVGPQEVRLAVRIADPTLSEAAYRAVVAGFLRSLSADVDGQLAVITDDGWRNLACRLLTGIEPTFASMPGVHRHQVWPVALLALDPYWRSDPISRTFSAAPPDLTPHAQTTGTGDFWLAESAGVSTATFANPGDIPAWPVWTVTGPTSGVVVGLAGNTIRYEPTLLGGQTLVIDTDPTHPRVTLDGANAWSGIAPDGYHPAPVPPGESVPLSIVSAGLDSGAQVTIVIESLFRSWM